MQDYITLFHVETPDFPAWLQKQLKKYEMSPADLARKMVVQDATISRILSGSRGVGKVTARKIALALKLDEDVVLYHAGLRSKKPESITEKLDPVTLTAVDLFERMTPSQRRAALATLQVVYEQFEQGTSGRSDAGTTKAVARQNKT